jgi:hypothetical protein
MHAFVKHRYHHGIVNLAPGVLGGPCEIGVEVLVMRRRWRSVVELALMFLIPAAVVAAQGKLESGVFRVRGLVLSPISDFHDRFAVQLLHESTLEPITSW